MLAIASPTRERDLAFRRKLISDVGHLGSHMENRTHDDVTSLSRQLEDILAAHGAAPTLIEVFGNAKLEPNLTVEDLSGRLASAATVVDLQQEKSTAEIRRDQVSSAEPVAPSVRPAGNSAKTAVDKTAVNITVAEESVSGTQNLGRPAEPSSLDGEKQTGDVQTTRAELEEPNVKAPNSPVLNEIAALQTVDSLFGDVDEQVKSLGGDFDVHDSFDSGFVQQNTKPDSGQTAAERRQTAHRTNQPTRATEAGEDSANTKRNALQRGTVQALQEYQIHKKHAEGGLGAVYLAQDQQLQRFVALKEMKPEFARNGKLKGRFLLEAQVTARLNHPSIAPVYQLGLNSDGSPFYTMKFISGQTLKESIQRLHEFRKHMPKPSWLDHLKATLRPFITSCHAIGFAHANGVLHRDIKPDNIMLGEFGESIVVDWGLAKILDTANTETAVDRHADAVPEFHVDQPETNETQNNNKTFNTFQAGDQTRDGSVSGTLAFMSPEQIRGQQSKLNATSDVYSLGCTLYVVLTGDQPIRGASVAEYTKRICDRDYRRPHEINHWVPKQLEAICAKAMSVEQSDRYSSVQAMIDDLEAWLDDRPLLALPDSRLERTSRWLRRNRRVAQVGVLGLMLVTLSTLLGFYLVNRARQKTNLALANEQLAVAATSEALENERAARGKARKALDTITDGFIGELLARQSSLTQQDRDVLQNVLKQYDQFATDSSETVEDQYFQAQGQFRIGDIRQQIGDLEEAAQAYRSAIASLKKLRGSTQASFLLGQVRNNLGRVYASLGETESARTCYQSAVDTLRPLTNKTPDETIEVSLAGALNNLGNIDWQLGRESDAVEKIEEALAVLDGEQAADALEKIQILTNYAGLLRDTGKFESAIAAAQEAVDLWENFEDHSQVNFHEDTGYRFTTPSLRMTGVLARTELASSKFKTEQYAESVKQLKQAVDEQQKLVGAYPQRTAYQRQLNRSKLKLGQSLDALNHPAAKNFLASAENGSEKLASNFPQQLVFQSDYAFALETIGTTRSARSTNEILDKLNIAEQLRKKLAETEPNNSRLLDAWLASQVNLANESRLAKKYARAEELYRSINKLIGRQRPKKRREKLEPTLHKSQLGLADSLSRQGKHEKAKPIWDKLVQNRLHPEWNIYELQRILCLIRMGKVSDGIEAVARLKADSEVTLSATDHYDIACCYSVAIDENQSRDLKLDSASWIQRGVESLENAHKAGFFENRTLMKAFATDKDLSGIDETEEFMAFLEAHSLNYDGGSDESER